MNYEGLFTENHTPFVAVSTPEILYSNADTEPKLIGAYFRVSASDWRQAMQLVSTCPGIKSVISDPELSDDQPGSFTLILSVDTQVHDTDKPQDTYVMEQAWAIYREMMQLLPGAKRDVAPAQTEAVVHMFPPSIAGYEFKITVDQIIPSLEHYIDEQQRELRSIRSRIPHAHKMRLEDELADLEATKQELIAELEYLQQLQPAYVYQLLQTVHQVGSEVEREKGFAAAVETIKWQFPELVSLFGYLDAYTDARWLENLISGLFPAPIAANSEIEA